MKYDVIIIGAGPAGISAALYAKSRGLNLLVLEKNKVGGIIGNVSTVTHYSGIIEKETGASFAERLKNQAEQSGVTIRYENVESMELAGEVKKVVTNQDSYEATAVILANGSTPRKLDIPGEKELAGNGIGLNAARDAEKYRGKNVYVVGGADGAIKEAIFLADYAKKVTIIHFEEGLGCIQEFKDKLARLHNVEYKFFTRLTAVSGKDHVEKLELIDVRTGEDEEVIDDGCGIFVYAGLIPNTQKLKGVTLQNDKVVVNDKMETNLAGVYAAGDIRVKQVCQVATAVSDGAVAAINACAYVAQK